MLSSLFSPLQLGPLDLPNRIVSTAHQTTLVHDHLPTDDFVAYHEARARGGVGMIVLEATAVHPTGLLTPHTLGGYVPGIAEAYRRVAAAVRPHGTRLLVQLFHGGREQIASPPRAPALAPSAVPSGRFRVEPRGLQPEEIEELVAGYARAAELAAQGCLDGVEVTAAHRYLIEQFFDPAVNRREDEWRDGRRLLVAIVDAVRDAAPGLALGVRLSADSGVARRMAEVLVGRVDYLSLALGHSSTYLGSTLIVPPPPLDGELLAGAVGPFEGGAPLVGTSRIVDPHHADALVAEGVVDAVGMTRALIADPDLPLKARQQKRHLRCIGCNVCIAHYHAGTPIACAVNPRTGRERTLPRPERAARRARVVVAGAGPAGLAAAVELLASGHEVVVLERTGRIGGQLALAGTAPGNAEVARGLVDLYRDVDVTLDTDATVASVLKLEPAAAIVATGARPYVPDLDLSGVDVMQSWEVLRESARAARRVVVADWGGDPGGMDAAELLRAAGNAVTLAVASASVGEGVHQYRRNLYLQRLYRAGVEVLQHHELAGAADGAVLLRNVFAPELERRVTADLLVLALGRVPVDTLAPELRARGLRVEAAGDCLSPRSLEEAVLEGTLAARAVFA